MELGARVKVVCTCGEHLEHQGREGVVVALPGFPFRDHRQVRFFLQSSRNPLIPVVELRAAQLPGAPPPQLSLF